MFRAYVPETFRAKETATNYIVASSWHFTLLLHVVIAVYHLHVGGLQQLKCNKFIYLHM